MAQGNSYRKMVFMWSFDGGQAPPAIEVRRGLGAQNRPPKGCPLPLPMTVVFEYWHLGGELCLAPQDCRPIP